MSVIFDNVYEDPRLEATLCKDYSAKKVLCVASGGCTALTLKTLSPDLQVSVADMNPDQLELVKEKVHYLESAHEEQIKRYFNIGDSYQDCFSHQAVFNRINRCLRLLINELLLPEEDLVELFSTHPYPTNKAKELFHTSYWDVIFQMIYSTSLVSVVLSNHVDHMLIRDRIGNFLRDNIRKGLCNTLANQNYILQRLFLGYYLPHALPVFLSSDFKGPYNFNYHHSSLEKVPDLESYDVVSLSNICSWMNTEQMKAFIHKLAERLQPGAVILLRETSSLRDPAVNPFNKTVFEPWFTLDNDQSERLLKMESSMLFDEIVVGTRK